jgi:hypothetical protein
MAFHVYHRFGECVTNPPLDTLDSLYAELEIDDDEHPSVSVQHESEWSLEAFPGGLLIWENVEDGNHPRHLKSVAKEKTIDLWRKLAAGDIEAVDSEAWNDGYG